MAFTVYLAKLNWPAPNDPHMPAGWSIPGAPQFHRPRGAGGQGVAERLFVTGADGERGHGRVVQAERGGHGGPAQGADAPELVPRFDRQGYGRQHVDERRRWVEGQTGAELALLGSFGIPAESVEFHASDPHGPRLAGVGRPDRFVFYPASARTLPYFWGLIIFGSFYALRKE